MKIEVLDLKPIKNTNITIFLIDKTKINLKLTDIDLLKALVNTNNVSFITVEMNNEYFKNFKNSNLSVLLNALNLEYFLLDMPEYAYGYLFDEIIKKEEQIRELSIEYNNMDNIDSFKGLNLKSWVDVLKKEVLQDINVLETKTRPQWIVKKILDLIRLHKNEEICLLHFFHEKSLIEITKQLRELHIEAILYEMNKFHNISYLTIKQEVNN
ncbi:MAG: hypothetical protein ACFFG0_52505 [Candidatus Thorarchaeota archaeon]